MEGGVESVPQSFATPLRRLAANPEFSSITRYIEFVEKEVRALADQSSEGALSAAAQRLEHAGLGGAAPAGRLERPPWWPAESLVRRLVAKMVRDLARDEGKGRIEYRVDGSGVRADAWCSRP